MPTAPRTNRRRLANAATVIPLAIGLASAGLPGGQPASGPSDGLAIVQKGSFNPVCTLPFAGVRNPALDDRCGIQGGSSDPAKQAESRAKNNFCAAKQPPKNMFYQDLIDLQKQAEKEKVPKSLPDRGAVEKMGEGEYVSYVAMIKDAHYSDVAKGEAVNCNLPGEVTNDIHIVLMSDPTDPDECNSTTAEISPHFRPPSWTPANLNALKKPVRIRGHLFYDGSHTPCRGTSRPNPKRASLWEIHPVYSVEVCQKENRDPKGNLEQCRNTSRAEDWVPLDEVLSSERN